MGGIVGGRLDLLWWRDLCSIEWKFDVESNWISLVIQSEVGSGNNTLFWKGWWIEEQRLNIRFSHLQQRNTMIVTSSCQMFEISQNLREKYRDCALLCVL